MDIFPPRPMMAYFRASTNGIGMNNKEIARRFSLLASLMELHGENAFKTKTYSSAFLIIRKWERPLADMTQEEIEKIPGIGKSVSAKIRELLDTGTLEALEAYKAQTPEGIQQLLSVRGLGPKKIRVIWDELNVESPTELLYACEENRLIKLSGFGLKTQEDLRKKIHYFLDSRDRHLYANLEEDLEAFKRALSETLQPAHFQWVGDYATYAPVVDTIECLVAPVCSAEEISSIPGLEMVEADEHAFTIRYDDRINITIHTCDTDNFLAQQAELTMSAPLFEIVAHEGQLYDSGTLDDSLANAGFDGLPFELWDKPGIEDADPEYWEGLITTGDIRGIVHNHSTWSDGMNTLKEMALHVRDLGYAYFAICDHSKSAFYANGLDEERVLSQMAEIDALNKELAPFKVYKGIESDILNDGALDYEKDILEKFDLIVASVHSNLRMDEEKAMHRLLTAIENPYTRILGHPTGRLLLAREGYPIDHRKVIDACAANGVAIELNANPLRLDIDYTWLDYCMEKGVPVSINPDAHSRAQVGYVKYGVYAARKGGLKTSHCLNALSLSDFEAWLNRK